MIADPIHLTATMRGGRGDAEVNVYLHDQSSS
jgi:hypothetical protein